MKKTSQSKTKKDRAKKQEQMLKPLEGGIPSGADKTARDMYDTGDDQLAAIIGSAPSIDALVGKAKAGGFEGDKAFAALIKIYTQISFNGTGGAEGEGVLFPVIVPDMEFYSQGWVQERLGVGFFDDPNEYFQKDVWNAVFSWVSGKPVHRAPIEEMRRRQYIILYKDEWNAGLREKQITYDDIRTILEDAGLLKETHYKDIKAFRMYLNRYGVKAT